METLPRGNGWKLIIIIIRAFVRRTMSASELNLRRRRLTTGGAAKAIVLDSCPPPPYNNLRLLTRRYRSLTICCQVANSTEYHRLSVYVV